MVIRTIVAALALLVVSAAQGGATQRAFSARVTNPWFPLKVGSRWVYTGIKDGLRARDVVTVIRGTKRINGVPCVVVHDRLYLAGRLRERTTDWYTQDRHGNVWYYGEATAELDRHGRVTSREGSWLAGVNGAKPGIFMPARPRVGASFRQEYYKGHAEDHFRVIGLFGKNGLLTREWTPLEPAVVDHKMYVRGVGEVLEQSQKGPNERLELISFSP